ncbi:hypothetical protein GCM10023191_086160 [Actinoallomurus oryzae]|uniref:General stress protein 17M-like domain-containing protein n=1 Tax=Actinoallomurus oryzae TaxID=502180 RepID=A0ABP8R1Q4_9ACTN
MGGGLCACAACCKQSAAFPVEHVTIVGTGLGSKETVLGRLTLGRVLVAGAVAGGWIGQANRQETGEPEPRWLALVVNYRTALGTTLVIPLRD